MKKFIILSILVFAITVMALANLYRITEINKYKKIDSEISKTDKKIVDANNQLGIKIFKSLVKKDKDKNIVISPLSIAVIHSICLNGARGNTYDEINNSLGYGNMELENINENYERLIRILSKADSSANLKMANSAWVSDKFEINSTYKNKLKKNYFSDIFSSDWSSSSNVSKMNSWINKLTNGKISGGIGEIEPDTVSLLLNTIYFKGKWENKFDAKLTGKETFRKKNGENMMVDMMHGNFENAAATISRKDNPKNFSMIKLPYAREKLAIYICIPRKIDEFVDDIDIDKLNKHFEDMWSIREASINLPKFKFEYENNKFKDILMENGINDVFDKNKANFKAIGTNMSNNLYISRVFNKSVVEVNEEGMGEAIRPNFNMPIRAASFGIAADRPFLFLIRDERTGMILFLGKFETP